MHVPQYEQPITAFRKGYTRARCLKVRVLVLCRVLLVVAPPQNVAIWNCPQLTSHHNAQHTKVCLGSCLRNELLTQGPTKNKRANRERPVFCCFRVLVGTLQTPTSTHQTPTKGSNVVVSLNCVNLLQVFQKIIIALHNVKKSCSKQTSGG